jgi:hypothetical protein
MNHRVKLAEVNFIVDPQRSFAFGPESTLTVSHVEMEISSKRENRVREPHPPIYNPPTPQTLTKNLPQLTLPFPTPQLKPQPPSGRNMQSFKMGIEMVRNIDCSRFSCPWWWEANPELVSIVMAIYMQLIILCPPPPPPLFHRFLIAALNAMPGLFCDF